MIDLKELYNKYIYKDKVSYLEWLEEKLKEEIEENDKLYQDIETLLGAKRGL